MARACLRRPFAGQERDFRLGVGEIAALEHACGAGLFAIAWRLNNHQASLADVREPIRLGLRGGGMADEAATKLILAEFDTAPVAQFFLLAVEIMNAVLNGLPPERAEEAEQEAADAPRPNALTGWHLMGFTMGLKPAEVDALTPAELVDLADQWRRMHPQRGEDGPGRAPSDAEAAAVLAAEARYAAESAAP